HERSTKGSRSDSRLLSPCQAMKLKSLKRQCFSGSGAFGSLPSPTWFIREHCIHVSITLSAFFTLQVCCAKFFGFSDEDKRLVRLSALVHDLGHGPFSHVSESALELFADRTKLQDRLKGDNPAKIHELLTQDLLWTDGHIT